MKAGIEVLQSVEELEEMGLVEVESSAAGDIVRLTTAGHEFTALRASVRAEGRDPDEDLVIRREGDDYAVYDLGEGGA
jgi:DNA-binding MarR family transcriptional regulator